MLAVGRVMFILAFKLKWVLFQPAKQNVHILMKTIRCVIGEDTVFMSCLAAAAWLHQMERRLAFFFILHSGRDACGSGELDKTGRNYRNISYLCFLSPLHSLALCLCNEQFPIFLNRTWHWKMFRCLSVLTRAVCMAPQRHNCQELYRAEQSRTTFVMGFGGSGRFCRRRDVSAFDQ